MAKQRTIYIDPETGYRYDKDTGRKLPEKKVSKYEVILKRTSKKKTSKPIIYQPRQKKNTFLKYWRVVRYWAKRKYNLSMEDLETFLYLYDEDLFTREQFNDFEGVLDWDKFRFKRLVDDGRIIVWRDHRGYKSKAKLYTLSIGTKRIVASIYKKLLQEERISETKKNNPIFNKDSYRDKVYSRLIEKMNAKKKDG